jgi:hypothetical protein
MCAIHAADTGHQAALIWRVTHSELWVRSASVSLARVLDSGLIFSRHRSYGVPLRYRQWPQLSCSHSLRFVDGCLPELARHMLWKLGERIRSWNVRLGKKY